MSGPGYVIGKALLRALADLRAAFGGAGARADELAQGANELAQAFERFGQAAGTSTSALSSALLQAAQAEADAAGPPTAEESETSGFTLDLTVSGAGSFQPVSYMAVSDAGGFPPTFNPHHWPTATSARDRVVLALMEQYGLDRTQAEALHAKTTALVERELAKAPDDTTPRGPRAVSFGQIQEKEDETK